jgi:hypothetical protein
MMTIIIAIKDWLKELLSLLAICFHTGFLLGLFFDPENGGDIFLRNVG